jgi:thiamine biosynthesis lipoprotein
MRTILTVLLLGTSAVAQTPREFTEVHMGVPVRIALYASSDATARTAARAAFAAIAELEGSMSDYRVDGELRKLERRAGEWVAVSPPLFAVLTRAREIAEASDGAFDPTVGPLVQLWREARKTQRLPSRGAIDSARTLVGWRLLSLHQSGRVKLDKPGMRLDLGGIAKGYILDSAMSVLAANGAPAALIEAGGDIVVGAAPPGKAGWRIDPPGADSAIVARAGALVRAAISTSGPSEQFVDIGGVRYSHVIDPRTGYALTHAGHATVIAADGATADALGTALTVLQPERRAELLRRYPAAIADVHQRPR